MKTLARLPIIDLMFFLGAFVSIGLLFLGAEMGVPLLSAIAAIIAAIVAILKVLTVRASASRSAGPGRNMAI